MRSSGFLLAIFLLVTSAGWSSELADHFEGLEGRAREMEACGDLDGALACYAEGMSINPAFYDTRFATREALEERIEGRRPVPAGEQLPADAMEGSIVYVFVETQIATLTRVQGCCSGPSTS